MKLKLAVVAAVLGFSSICFADAMDLAARDEGSRARVQVKRDEGSGGPAGSADQRPSVIDGTKELYHANIGGSTRGGGLGVDGSTTFLNGTNGQSTAHREK